MKTIKKEVESEMKHINASKILITILSVSVLLGMSLASCAPAAEKTAAKTLKFGVITALSGGGAPWGIPNVTAWKWAAEDVNAAGGLKVGKESYTIDILTDDDRYLPEPAMDAANRLVAEEGVHYLTGLMGGSPGGLAMASLLDEYKVISFNFFGDDRTIGSAHPYAFRCIPPYGGMSDAIYRYCLKTYPDVKTVAMVNPAGAGGEAVMKASKEAAASLGINVVGSEFYERGTTDFYPILTKLLAAKPDLLNMGATAAGDMGLIIKQAKELGYKGHMCAESTLAVADVVKVAGKEAVEGLVGVGQTSVTPANFSPQQKKIYDEVVAKFGDKAGNPLSICTYRDVFVIAQSAIQMAGTVDTVKVAEILHSGVTIDTPFTGPIRFGGEKTYGINCQICGAVALIQVKDGNPVNQGVANIQIP